MGKKKKDKRQTPMMILTKNSFLYNANVSEPSPFNNPKIPVAGENLCSLDFFLQSIQSAPTFHNMMENPMINNWISTTPSSLSMPFVQPRSIYVNPTPILPPPPPPPPTQTNKPLPLLSIPPHVINPIKIENKQTKIETLKVIPKQKVVPVEEEQEETKEDSTSDIQGDIIYRRFQPNKSLLRHRNNPHS